MSSVLGIDLSTRAVDLVKLDESTNAANWTRVELDGKTALERLRHVWDAMPGPHAVFWDEVYLVAIEAPMSRLQPGTLAKLSRVFGALVACVPPALELWEVAPVAWRKELGLPGNASKEECQAAVKTLGAPADWSAPDPYDAYAVAYFARQTNDRGVHQSSATGKDRAA